jgi:hypothetical protein
MESKGALFTVAIPLIAFKIWFAILLLTYAPTRDSMVWIAATHWPLVIIVGFLIGPGIAVYRLMRARAKREALRRAEFMLTPRPVQCSALWETVSRLEGE